MFPEKPKNKQKNDRHSRKRLIVLLPSVIVVLLAGIFLYYASLPTCRLTAPKLFYNIQSVQIQDHWTGLSPFAPIKADYTFTMTEDGVLAGDAMFSIANDNVTHTTPIEIPAETVEAFIKMLETAKLEQRPYEPFWQWTDDYPYISIFFKTDQAEIEIFTSSQGESHTPWGAEIDDVEYVIDSDIPMQAYSLLEPYLQRGVLETMIDEYKWN
jgi:hypothetical protein